MEIGSLETFTCPSKSLTYPTHELLQVITQQGNSSGRTRTGDPRLMNPLLYQLSYAAVGC